MTNYRKIYGAARFRHIARLIKTARQYEGIPINEAIAKVVVSSPHGIMWGEVEMGLENANETTGTGTKRSD